MTEYTEKDESFLNSLLKIRNNHMEKQALIKALFGGEIEVAFYNSASSANWEVTHEQFLRVLREKEGQGD